MKNKVPTLILLIAVIIPQVASAAWWDPFSWFEEKPEITKLQPCPKNDPIGLHANCKTETTSYSNNPEILDDASSTIKSEQIEKVVVKEIPIEKVVEKIVTKPDQSVVNENNVLKNKIVKLETKIQELEKISSTNESKKRELVAEISNIESTINKVLLFGIYCYQPLSSTKSLSCASGLSESQQADKAIELELIKSGLLSSLSKLGGTDLLNSTTLNSSEIIEASIKSTEEKWKQKEINFFNDLLFNSDYSGDAESRLCYTWAYRVHLDTLDQICKQIIDRNMGQK